MRTELKIALSTVAILLATAGTVMFATAMRDGSSERALLMPVMGVRADQLADSWGAPRGRARVHRGIDIGAREGTPVRAATAGTIAKLFLGKRGGITVTQLDEDGRLFFYYAHLKAYAPGLREGDRVAQGQMIGTVGATGNATTPHLHFEIHRAKERFKWWRGVVFNPYGALKAGWVEASL